MAFAINEDIEGSDEKAKDEECDDDEEAEDEMDVIGIDDEVGVVEAGDEAYDNDGIEASIVGT